MNGETVNQCSGVSRGGISCEPNVAPRYPSECELLQHREIEVIRTFKQR